MADPHLCTPPEKWINRLVGLGGRASRSGRDGVPRASIDRSTDTYLSLLFPNRLAYEH